MTRYQLFLVLIFMLVAWVILLPLCQGKERPLQLKASVAPVTTVMATTTLPPTTITIARAARSRTVTRPTSVPHPPSTGGQESWRATIARLFGAAAPQAFSVVQCESGWNPNAVGPRYVDPRGGIHYPHGLFQVMDGPFDPEANIAAAYSIYAQTHSWRRWDRRCRP